MQSMTTLWQHIATNSAVAVDFLQRVRSERGARSRQTARSGKLPYGKLFSREPVDGALICRLLALCLFAFAATFATATFADATSANATFAETRLNGGATIADANAKGTGAPGTSANNGATILVLGDSLSAAYGIPRESGWVALLQQKLAAQKLTNGKVANVVNASISGETTDGGLARLPTLLEKHRPALVVLELGANDGLRGFQIRRLRDNLEQLIRLSQASGAKVLLVGIKIPPNYGLRYTSDFYESFTLLASEYKVPLVPFLLDGVATDPELMQDDRLHPRAEAQAKILNNVWPHLHRML
jgi:acyl-CoA thioesterase-1